MWSVLKAAWRVVARRAVSDKAILFASFATILLAITLMAAGPIYADAVTLSSLRRTLLDSPVTDVNMAITTRVRSVDFEDTDDQVFSLMNDAFEGIGGEIYRRGTSDSYSVTGLEGVDASDLIVFRFFTGIEERAHLVGGRWPAPGADLMQAAIPTSVAEAYGLEVGSRFEAAGRSHDSLTQQVEVVGIYQVIDSTDPYWMEDPLDLTGVTQATFFTTHGPFVIAPDVFFSGLGQQSAEMRWTVFPNHDQMEIGDIGPILRSLTELDARLNSTRELGNLMQIDTELPTTLLETQRSQLVTRSAVLILTIQLAVLAAYALLLSSGMLADTRAVETTTLRARGAGSGQLLAMAAMEGLMMVVPALAIAPFLASSALRVFNTVGPLAGIGLGIQPVVTPAALALAAIAATGCVVAVVVPGYRSARRLGNVRASRARQPGASVARRAGADIALLVVAGLGVWQLARYGAPLTRNVQGRLGVDPLLVAAPALSLLAGAVLALRALPLMARVGEFGVSRGRRLVASLGIWHLGRQPRPYARSALMLILAIAIGVFALSYDATWQKSQHDQAAFATGADILVTPDHQIGKAIPGYALSDAYGQLAGEELSVPVAHAPAQIDGSSLPIEYVLIEPEKTADVMDYRSDQAPQPISELLAAITTARPEKTGLPVAGSPTGVAVVVSVVVGPIPPDLPEQSSSAYDMSPTLRVIFTDADAIPFRIDLGRLDQSGSSVRLTGQIGYTNDEGELLTPQYPLRLLGMEVRDLAPFHPYVRLLELTIESVELTDDGRQWGPLALPGADAMTAATSSVRSAGEDPTIGLTTSADGTLTARMGSGTTGADTRQPVYFMVRVDPKPEIDQIPVLAATGLLDDLGLEVGDPLPLDGLTGFQGAGAIVGEFTTFPTVDPSSDHAIVLDYPTYLGAVFGPGVLPPDPESYWLSVDDASLDAAANQLRNSPYDSPRVITRAEALTDLALDPVSLGTIGSLMMGLMAAAILAGIGFIVNVVVSTRERLGQFALMRAIGVSKRQILSSVALENGITTLFALIFGTLLGLTLSNIVLPLTAITQEGVAIVPDLVVIHPWGRIAILQAAVIVTLIMAMYAASRMLSKLQLAALLRAGEE